MGAAVRPSAGGAAAALALVLIADAALARSALGIFGDWGAFRDADGARCYAIAEPDESTGGGIRPFASVGHWPQRGVRGQFQVRLAANVRAASAIVNGQRFALAVGSNNGWAQDKRMDAALVSAMRSAERLRIEAVTLSGGRLVDIYRLKGAASAIDAAALGCARR